MTALGRETGGVRRTALFVQRTESSWLTMTKTPRSELRQRCKSREQFQSIVL